MKIIVILGQTSTGKSNFAVQIAKQISGKIISADSRQVYKGMTLGTGKVPHDHTGPSCIYRTVLYDTLNTKKQKPKIYLYKGVSHYLLDVASPSRVFSVSDFQRLANKKIKEIINKGKIPIICGGTGFYIDAIVNGTTFPEVPPNKELRKKLYSKSAIALFEYLKKLDPERAKNIDKNNKVRLIRAIEIAKVLGRVPSARPCLAENKFKVLKIGLTIPPEILKERIKIRLLSRIKKGMIKEVEDLHKKGVSWKRMNTLGLEYRYVSLYLQKKLSKEEMVEKLNTAIWHYAKRQKTWFKRDPNIIWINPRKKSSKARVLKEIKKFLK